MKMIAGFEGCVGKSFAGARKRRSVDRLKIGYGAVIGILPK